MQQANISTSSNQDVPFMQFKVYLEDLTNIVEVCTKKCVDNYNQKDLNTTEKLCLEKCYVKSLDMNQYLTDEFPNIMSDNYDKKL